jgi:uncharacterized membrane protein YoaK (UPF0700 family)
MPLHYLRRLTGQSRTASANRHLARYLAFIAGAINAGGFLAARQYTSHMTGIVSAMADNLALGSIALAFSGLAAVLAFLGGAICTTMLIRWARDRIPKAQYSLPLLVESILLLLFGLTGRAFAEDRFIGTVMLLCFTMGLQNAMITKLSDAVIRTTHLTGMVTDIGIELGRMLTSSFKAEHASLPPNGDKLMLLSSLVAIFFLGGVTGAVGFKHVGFLFALPLAEILSLIAAMPLLDELHTAWHSS